MASSVTLINLILTVKGKLQSIFQFVRISLANTSTRIISFIKMLVIAIHGIM